MEHSTNLFPEDLPPTSGEQPGFFIAPDLLWQPDPSRAVVTWTPDFFSPPIAIVLDSALRETVLLHEQRMQAYVADGEESQLPTIPPPPGNAVYHAHDLLSLLKRIQVSPQGPDIRGIADAIANVTSSVRAFYRLLTSARWFRRHVYACDRAATEVLLSLALYRPVYFWFAHEIQPWQPWQLVDYAITAEETTAILTVARDTVQRQWVYDLRDPMKACTVIFEPY